MLALLGLQEAEHSARGEVKKCEDIHRVGALGKIVRKSGEEGDGVIFCGCACVFFVCVKEKESVCVCGGFDKHRGGIVHASVCACVCLGLHGLSVSSCMLTESGG